MERDWLLNKTGQLIRALAGIAEYRNTLPNYYRGEDEHDRRARDSLLSQHLAMAMYSATKILAREARVDWKPIDGEHILEHGQIGFEKVLIRYDLPLTWDKPPPFDFAFLQPKPIPLASLDGLANHWTFATFDVGRELQGPEIWDEVIVDEDQQREMLTHAVEQSYRYAQEPGGWLLLAGPVGVGKSHLATAIIWEAQNNGLAPLYISALDVVDRYRSPEDPRWLGEQQIIDGADLLVMDNLYLQDRIFWNSYIEQLLRARHRDHLPTVLVSTRSREHLPRWLGNVVTEIALVASDHRQLRGHVRRRREP